MAGELVEQKAKNIIESKILAMARSDAGIYGQRLLVRLVQMTQQYVRGDNLDQVLNKERIEVGLWGDALIRFRVSSILSSEDDKNHTMAKKAINALIDSKLEFENDDVYETTHILGRAKLYKNTGIAEILVMSTVWQAMLDFSKGYFQYDPDVAVRLTSEYALILYKQLRGQTKPLTYSFDKLRELFHIKDKYKKNADIIDKVLKPAKDELDEISSISFSYQKAYSSGADKAKVAPKRGRTACIGVTITPVHLTRNDKTDELARKVDISMILSRELRGVLQNKFDFEYGGMKANISLFDSAIKQLGENGYMDWLDTIAPQALRANNPQGYVVNATRQMLNKKFGIIINPEKPVVENSAPSRKGIQQSLANQGPLGGLFGSILDDMK